MLKFMVPFDGSEPALRALRHVIRLNPSGSPQPIQLLNVREPAQSWQMHGLLNHAEIDAIQQSEGESALQPARDALDAAGIPYEAHVVIGPIAPTIAKFATEHGCDHIVMGTHGTSALAELFLGSVASKVIHLATLPVTVVK